ncbi:MAG: hypothetical protein EOO39_31560 [Cytophagaceae bacterium]|nr:MAG: hypothetical protein EOO39_31560 [Cytophagaceae bacterium]
MTTPGGCSDIPAGSVSGGSGSTSYANSDFTPASCSGTDALIKTWNDATGNYFDIPGLTNYTGTVGVGNGAINIDQYYGSQNTANIAAITAADGQQRAPFRPLGSSTQFPESCRRFSGKRQTLRGEQTLINLPISLA